MTTNKPGFHIGLHYRDQRGGQSASFQYLDKHGYAIATVTMYRLDGFTSLTDCFRYVELTSEEREKFLAECYAKIKELSCSTLV